MDPALADLKPGDFVRKGPSEPAKQDTSNQNQPDQGAAGADPGAGAGADTDNSTSAAADGGSGKTDDAGASAAPAADASTAQDGASGSTDNAVDLGQDVFNTLTHDTGVEVRTREDLTSRLKELADFKAGKAVLPGLSPALVKAIEVERSGGNLIDFFRAFTLDEAQMLDMDVLKHVHLQTDKLASKNLSLAGKEFDRLYKREFAELLKWNSTTDDVDKEAFYKEHADDIDYQKELYAHRVKEGREAIKAQKDNYSVESPAQGPSKEEQDLLIKKHSEAVEATLTGFKVIDIPIEGQEKFSVGLNAKTKPLVEKWMRDMPAYLAHIGIKPDGFDLQKLHRMMVLTATLDDPAFGALFKKQILDNKDINTLENDLKGNRVIDRGTKAGSAAPLTDEQEIAKQAREKREGVKK